MYVNKINEFIYIYMCLYNLLFVYTYISYILNDNTE